MIYADLCELVPDENLPLIDRPSHADVIRRQHSWQRDGFVHLDHFMPDFLIDAYCRVREQLTDPNGYPSPTPYLDVPEIADLCCYRPLADVIEQLIGEPAGLHLNLTGWRSSDRDWHADSFLAPEHVGGFYVAAWIALADIHPHSGPFEFIPGSHQPANHKLSMSKVTEEIRRRGGRIEGDWSKQSEDFLSQMIEEEITRRETVPSGKQWYRDRFLANRGDILLWHSGLIHRGSKAIKPGMERRALIAHYSGINHKHSAEWPDAIQHESGGWLFPFGEKI